MQLSCFKPHDLGCVNAFEVIDLPYGTLPPGMYTLKIEYKDQSLEMDINYQGGKIRVPSSSLNESHIHHGALFNDQGTMIDTTGQFKVFRFKTQINPEWTTL